MSNSIDMMLPGEPGLGDDIAARLDGIGCLALRLNWIQDEAARMICLDALFNAAQSIAPKSDEKQGFGRFRAVQAESQ